MANSRNYFHYILKDYQNSITGESKIEALKSNIISAPVEMLITKGWPLLNLFNEQLLKLTETGLIDFWSRSIMHQRAIEKVQKSFCLKCDLKFHLV